jgi:Ca2+-transporting ATPase
VRRDGELREIPAQELVPGDVVSFEAGDLVTADGRLISAATLEIDGAALTGESIPTSKLVDAVAEDAPLGDRHDMAFMNTNVTRGSGQMVVVATGMTTEVGHISGMLQVDEDQETPLTRQINTLTNQLLVIAGLALLASISIGYFIRGDSFNTLFVTAIAFAVSAIPTGLPAVITTILSYGTQTLAKAHAIVKQLRSVETLGSTSAINSDKTGTLTLNQMTAVQMAVVGRRYSISGEGYSTEGQITHVGGQPDVPLDQLLLPMALCADAEVRDGALVGDPTEGALVVLAAKGGVDPTLTRERYPRVATLPFDAAYKFMATFHRMEDDNGKPVIRAFVKGAPDQLLARAGSAHGPDGAFVPIDRVREPFLTENDRLGAQGLRVMATAQRDFDPKTFDPDADLLPLIQDLQLLAIVGIVDPPRAEARDAIAKAKSAGIRVRMITGDHAITAGAIASQLGIVGEAITGAEFSAYSDEEADRRIDDIGIIARVTGSRYEDTGVSLHDFTRIVGDVKGYIPLGSRNRTIALRVRTSHSIPDDGKEVPFYLMETLGGAKDVRGYFEYRFRDTRNLLASAEYRWEVWNYLDFSFFFDAGKVGPDWKSVRSGKYETGWGIGARLHGPAFTIWRIELARTRQGFNLVVAAAPPF